MEEGDPFFFPTPDAGGVNFSLYSEAAERVELCLFDTDGRNERRIVMPGRTGNRWHGYLRGCRPGQLYGYRVHGRYAPQQGLRCNPAKLLLDPAALALQGAFRWAPAVCDYLPEGDCLLPDQADSAHCIPKCVVSSTAPELSARQAIPWRDMIVCETNVRGYTMRHPSIPASERGTFAGMRNHEILDYLKALGISSIELMPVQETIDERFLVERGLRNFWGYNPISFFVPMRRYGGDDARAEFVSMVNAIHDAGMEVILDVVYNHTAESDRFGPTLSFRGIDNRSYYRLEAGAAEDYVDDTGCGNTINTDHPEVRALILESLTYWHSTLGVDGFRFDLATVLGRTARGFDHDHPMLRDISSHPPLAGVKLVAEPWDPGPGGYQLGNFPSGWAEWNDRYRDAVRRFWRGDPGAAGEFARRIHGSADLFEAGGRGPAASVNFVSAHDGFTLADVVSYERRHNDANGEDNRDGHSDNLSCNYGVEGPTEDRAIQAIRRRQRLNMLATLLLSHGTPLLLGGDEFGNSQGGNNNAYAQDNDTGWTDWSGVAEDPAFLDDVRALIALRRDYPLLRSAHYRHGHSGGPPGWRDIEWLGADGRQLDDSAWRDAQALTRVLWDAAGSTVAVLFNASDDVVRFVLPERRGEPEPDWRTAFYSGDGSPYQPDSGCWQLAGKSLACLVSG